MVHLLAAAVVLTAITAAVPATAQPASSPGSVASVTTRFDLKRCAHTKGTDVEDYGSWRCRGHAGLAVHVAGGDQRDMVSFGRNAAQEPAAAQTLAAFNHAGNAIEWRGLRGADGKVTPYAAIMRWGTTVASDDRPIKGAMLVVTRLPPGAVCHVGYVDALANPDAQALAHRIADEHARTFKCGSDKPVVLGKRGPGFSGSGED